MPDIAARLAIINPIAVADAEAVLSAEPPDGVLNKPWEHGRERRTERTGVDLLGNTAENFGAVSSAIMPCLYEFLPLEHREMDFKLVANSLVAMTI